MSSVTVKDKSIDDHTEDIYLPHFLEARFTETLG